MPDSLRSDLRALETAVARLGSPLDPLDGHQPGAVVVPERINCFQGTSAARLNQPRTGRALHHRFVLIFALRTAVTVCVDDREIRLNPGTGLLIFPFQFHHYIDPEREQLRWLFVTFETSQPELLEPLRHRAFKLETRMCQLASQLASSFQEIAQNDVTTFLLGLVLARLRRLESLPVLPTGDGAADTAGFVAQINRLVHREGEMPRLHEIARAIGISPSHLRARFRASCGVSLGRHLRRLRLERACGMLRLSESRVSEIAEQCGFSSVYAFSRTFRAAFSISPLAYRNRGLLTHKPLHCD